MTPKLAISEKVILVALTVPMLNRHWLTNAWLKLCAGQGYLNKQHWLILLLRCLFFPAGLLHCQVQGSLVQKLRHLAAGSV